MYRRDYGDTVYRELCNPCPFCSYLIRKVRLFGGIPKRSAGLVESGAMPFQESHLWRGSQRTNLASIMAAGCVSRSCRRGKKEVQGGNEWSRSGRRQTLESRHWRTTDVRRSQCHSYG